MAARENTGLQVAVIIFVMTTIASFIAAVVFWMKIDTEQQKADQAQQQAQQQRQAALEAATQNQRLKEFLGHKPDESMDVIERAYNEDMLKFGADFPEETRNYRTLPEYLFTAIRDRNAKAADLALREQQLIAEKERLAQMQQALVAKAQEGFQTTASEYVRQRTTFSEERARVLAEKDRLAANLVTAQQEVAKVAGEKAKEIEALETQLNRVDQQRQGLIQRIAGQEREQTEDFDGAVTFVNQSARTVWINRGQADGLRRQTIFSVYGREESNLATARKKGSIEVTRILDQHLAEARIVEDDLANPILTGDKIASPVWRPGRQLRFALAGLIDIDGDGRSDLERVRNLITMNNGIVDAVADEQGNRTGELSINTRYLVVGERPTETASREAINAFSAIQREATDLGVERISVGRLLDLMGYTGGAQVAPMGRFGAESQPSSRPAGGGASERPAGGAAAPGGFQPRQPRSAF